MKQLQADLWETTTESPFPGLTTHAYLLKREAGNVLFYNTSQPRDIEQMADLGGVAFQFLSHRDELGPSLQQIRQRFGAQLGGHVAEQADYAEICSADIRFSQREWLLDNVEVIPTPGHTPGSVCFLVESAAAKTYLFTGDTLYLTDEGWQPGMLSFSSREQLIESLKLLKTLQPDIVFSSAFSGKTGFEIVTEDWSAKVQTALCKLELESAC